MNEKEEAQKLRIMINRLNIEVTKDNQVNEKTIKHSVNHLRQR